MSSANFDMERFNLRKPNDVEAKKGHQVKSSNGFSASEKLDDDDDDGGGGGGGGDDVDFRRAWKIIREYTKASDTLG